MSSKEKFNQNETADFPPNSARRSFDIRQVRSISNPRDTVSIDMDQRLRASLLSNPIFDSQLEVYAPADTPTLIDEETLEFLETPKQSRKNNSPKFGNSKRIKTIAAGLVLGVVLSFTFIVVKEAMEPNGKAAEALASTEVAANVLELPAAAISETLPFSIPDTKYLKEVTVKEVPLVPDSGIVEYSNSQPIILAPRNFTYFSGSQRVVGASLIQPQRTTKAQVQKKAVTAQSLKPLNKNGRAVDDNTATEWQGGFDLNSPNNNLRQGRSYADYAKKYGTSSLNSLSVVQQPRSSLVKSLKGSRLAPKANQ